MAKYNYNLLRYSIKSSSPVPSPEHEVMKPCGLTRTGKIKSFMKPGGIFHTNDSEAT